MRIRTVRYILKEGTINAYRNKLMSLASTFIVVATLIIFGFFLLTAFSMELTIQSIMEQPQIEVFCYTVLDDTQVKMVEDSIKSNEMIDSYEVVTKEQALNKMKERLGKDAAVLEGYDKSIFPVSFIVKLKDTSQSREAVEYLENISGVEKVSYSQGAIDFITKVSKWANIALGVIIAALLVVSVFIIANTIKLTVFARRKEISIMKYIGATDWFIRWPFVVEGVIIGMVGALIAFAVSAYGYNVFESRFSHELTALGTDLLKLVSIKDAWTPLIVSFLTVGTGVGALGSFLSIRRYLRV